MSSTLSTEPTSPHRSRGRRVRDALKALAIGLVATLVALEACLHFLPVNRGFAVQPVQAERPVLHFEPQRTFTWSKGPRLAVANEIRTNNVGFRSDRDYALDGSEPLLALIGDSYVVAAMVPFPETLGARLERELGDAGDVYALAAAGAAFPQYLVWAEYARDHFHPDAFVFVVTANDFPVSLRPTVGYHHFARNPDDSSSIVLKSYSPGWKRRLFRHSSLVMYLEMNLQVRNRLAGLLSAEPSDLSTRERFVGNIEAHASPETMELYRWVLRSFLDRLPEATGVSYERTVVVLGGIRPHMYDPVQLAFAETSAWAELRVMVLAGAGERGIEVVDLHPLFTEHFQSTGQRFEGQLDNHWNRVGHGIAARASADTRVVREVFGAPRGVGDDP